MDDRSTPNDRLPVIVVGAGPAGLRFSQRLHALRPALPLHLIGAEARAPYDRVRLSSALAGDCDWASLEQGWALPEHPGLQWSPGVKVTAIDRDAHQVVLAGGDTLRYRQLVLATGSTPHVPNIPGTDLPGVYRFRDARDAEQLSARRVRSRRIVVLGGGLLGLEAARAMRRFNTDITLVEHSDRLMSRQLDITAAALLHEQVRALGLKVIVDDGALALHGRHAVQSVALRSGRSLPADTVIIATGIVPNTALALASGLPIGRGIKVDDQLRTGDPDISAIGECAEHDGVVYGLVAPCLEQGAVAASVIAGTPARYRGSVDGTRLKVMKTTVFAAGAHPDRSATGAFGSLIFKDPANGHYRRLLHARGRLAGVLGVGDWAELPRAMDAVQQGQRIGWGQRWRFRRSGQLWPAAESASVAAWPAGTTVCNCTGVTRGTLSEAMGAGCQTRAALAERTRASTVCGSCIPLLESLLGAPYRPEPVRGAKPLLGMAALASLAAALTALLPGVPYVAEWSSQGWRWDALWRDGFIKQVTGFSLAGLAVAGLVLSLRKRIGRLAFGHFALWRNLHVALGLAAVGALLLHTGGRLGHGLNALLMGIFLLLIIAGGAAAVLAATEHRLAPAQAKRLRGGLNWLHILAFWPLPALLGFHVLKTYYY